MHEVTTILAGSKLELQKTDKYRFLKIPIRTLFIIIIQNIKRQLVESTGSTPRKKSGYLCDFYRKRTPTYDHEIWGVR